MKQISLLILLVCVTGSCDTPPAETKPGNDSKAAIKDTPSYPYKALYSSDLTVPSNPENARRVLTVWKMYENKQIEAMKPYYADTVTYDDAQGNHFHGASESLLQLAKKEMDTLDSLRFDISMWESVHSNDKNEDWVNIWCTERSYPKTGKADTALMYEKWMLKDGRVYYFNQYYEKLKKK